MYITQQALDIVGISYDDYLQWCTDNHRPPYKKKTRKEFFERIKDGKIAKDKKTGELINKRPRNSNDEE